VRATPRAQLAILSAAMVLGMAPWFSATAVAPFMIAEWRATPATATWLTMAVQAGFVAGTCASALLLLSDRWSARRLAGWSAAAAALATGALAARGLTPAAAIALRALTGAALAGVYPPGMKLAAGWWRERRGMAIGVLVGALTLGSATPNLVRALVPAQLWRPTLGVAAASAALAAVLFLALVREGPYQAPSVPFEWRALRRLVTNRPVVLATGGYLGHMWELYAMWSSIGLFWGYVVARRGLASPLAPALAFATIGVGVAGCVVAGVVADRVGRAAVTIVAMAASGACALLVGALVDAPLPILVTIAFVWGIAIIADSAQFSACITEVAPPQYVGTALTMQTSLGFLLTIVSIRLVPVWAAHWGWERAYMPLAIGPALGILAMVRFARARMRVAGSG
jgi:MFS family permease